MNKYYTAHVMLCFTGFSKDLKGWMLQMKKAGYNLFWAYMDYYNASYQKWTKEFLDAAQEVNIPVMIGTQSANSGANDVQLVKDTWNHPALFTINGKKVYSKYAFNNKLHLTTIVGLTQAGFQRSQYMFLVNGLYTLETDWIKPNTFQEYGSGYPREAKSIDYMYDHYDIDGLIGFAIDKKLEWIIEENNLISEVSQQRGKVAMAGVGAYYASVSFYDFGFDGAASIWDAILKLPLDTRPLIVSDTTADDYTELSYMSPMLAPATNGLCYFPSPDSGINLGDNIRYPFTDHSGVQAFLQPWAHAFLNNQAAPHFSRDRIFAWYELHPLDVSLNPVLPKELAVHQKYFTQDWWSKKLYATGKIPVAGINQIEGITKVLGKGFGKIRMAAHLTKPAKLNINHTVSDTMPAGPAYFEIDMADFRGVPSFAIIRNNKVVKSGLGKQPITDNVYPGGWNYLSTEV